MHANRNGKRYLTKSKTVVQAQKKTLLLGRGGQAGARAETGSNDGRLLARAKEVCNTGWKSGSFCKGGREHNRQRMERII